MNTKMLTTGAYSKKYQQIERDKLQHLRDQEKRTNRERVLLLSKQTAQRQKALEEKKRAMAVAEEQRRRKALDDRRKAQLEATARFRSAMCRVKSNPRAKHKPMDNIEIYLPDKAKAAPKGSSGSLKVQQRVAYGRDVEVKHTTSDDNSGHTGLQKRTPSLDDVLNQIRGIDQTSNVASGHPPMSSQHTPHSHGHINVHHHSSAVIASSTSAQHVPTGTGSIVNYAEVRTTPLLRGRSASDSNLSTLAVHHHTSPVKAQQSSDGNCKDVPDTGEESDKLKLIEVESEVASNTSDELMFKPVTNIRSTRNYPNYTSVATRTAQSDDGMRVISPEPAESSSSSDRSFSPPPSSLNDSLDQPPLTTPAYADSSMAKQVRTFRQQQRDGHVRRGRVRLTSSHKKTDLRERLKSDQSSAASLKVLGVPAAGAPRPPTPATPPSILLTSQPIYVCQESESSNSSDADNDSLDEEGSYSRSSSKNSRCVAHRSKKHVQQPTKGPVGAKNEDSSNTSQHKDEPKAETQGQSSSSAPAEMPFTNSKPKIVGILKKTSSSSIESSQSVSSTHMERTPSSKANTSSQISTASSAKSQKRVRFVDQVATNNRQKATHAIHSNNLWNHVLPNGLSTQHLPNSAFTPRMRVLLSSKAPTIPAAVNGPPKRPTGPSNPNGITVHVPFASVESPPSPSHPPLEQKSHQDSNSSDEDTTTDKNDVQPPKECNKNGIFSKNAKVGGEPTVCNCQNATAKSMEDNSSKVSNGGGDDATHPQAHSVSERSLDKTPTDNEINEMWEQIKTCLEENKQSTSVPVQVYPFQMPTVNGLQRYGSASQRENNIATDTSALSLQREQNQATVATSGGNSHSSSAGSEQQNSGPPVKLVHRQSNRNRPMRCQHQLHNQAQLVRRHQNHTPHDYGGGGGGGGHTHHGHSATYPFANQDQSPQGQVQLVRVYPPMQMSSREPELVVRATASPINGRIAPTSLSLEEQRLLQSIEKLNQRLKDHLVRPQEPVFQPPGSPESHVYPAEYFPHHHHQATPPRPHPPHNGRSRGHTTDLPKSSSGGGSNRVHWHHKNTAVATASNNSRTQLRTKTHRQDFYNT